MTVYIRKTLISLFFFCRLQHFNSSSLCKTHCRHFSSKLISPKNKYVKEGPETCDSVVSFFKHFGFSTTQIQKIVKRSPQILSAGLDLDLAVKPRLKILEEVGGLSPVEVAEIISINPLILKRRIDLLDSALRELKKHLRVASSSQGLFILLNKNAYLLKHNFQSTLIPNKEFLKKICGVGDSEIARFFGFRPRVFLLKHERLKECVERVDQMGVPRDSNAFLYAISSLGSMSVASWERKLELFTSLGFSDHDIRSTFRRIPMVFSISERKIKDVTEVLLNARNDDISLIVSHPGLLIYSVEKRLKPRLRVLEVLEKKNLLVKKKPKISTACRMTDKSFMMNYVLPYFAEVGTLYPIMSANDIAA